MRFLARLIRWWVKLSKASAKRLAIRKWPIKELSIKPKAPRRKLGVTQRMRQTRYANRKKKLPSRRPITFATISASQWRMPRRRLKRRSTNSKTVTLDKLRLQQSRRPGTLPGRFFEVGLDRNRGPPCLVLRRTKKLLPAGSADFQNSRGSS